MLEVGKYAACLQIFFMISLIMCVESEEKRNQGLYWQLASKKSQKMPDNEGKI